MKVAVDCKSPLLQKSLELFLTSHLSSIKQCDIVVRDFKSEDKKTFYISTQDDADLLKPFSKSALMLALEKRYEDIVPKIDTSLASAVIKHVEVQKKVSTDDKIDFSILEKRIDFLTSEYKQNILKAVRAFYEE